MPEELTQIYVICFLTADTILINELIAEECTIFTMKNVSSNKNSQKIIKIACS